MGKIFTAVSKKNLDRAFPMRLFWHDHKMSSVHSSIQSSRFSSMRSAGSVAGSEVISACFFKNLRQFSIFVGRKDKHLEWNVLLKGFGEKKIDHLLSKFYISASFQDSNKFNLSECCTVIRDNARWRFIRFFFGKVHLSRRAGSITDDNGTIPIGCRAEFSPIRPLSIHWSPIDHWLPTFSKIQRHRLHRIG